MVHEDKQLLNTMGQIGLCSVNAPQTDSLSPINSGVDGIESNWSNGVPSDLMVSKIENIKL